MARYTGPNNKRARRVNFSILESGKDMAKRPYGPGQHGKDRKRKTAAVMTAVFFVYLTARVSNGLKPRFSF